MKHTLRDILERMNRVEYTQGMRIIIRYPESAYGEDIVLEYDNAEQALYTEVEENYAGDYIVELVEYLGENAYITISQGE